MAIAATRRALQFDSNQFLAARMLRTAMISADEALQTVLANVSRLGIERVPMLNALGRVLAEEIHSPRDIPGFDNSAMDGYAVRAADIATASETRPVRLRVLGTVAAGMMPAGRLEAGHGHADDDWSAAERRCRRDRAGRADARRRRYGRDYGLALKRVRSSAARRRLATSANS